MNMSVASDYYTLKWLHMSGTAVQIIGNLTVYRPTGSSGWHQRQHQSSVLLTFLMGNPPFTDGFHSQTASNVESVSMSWRHHVGIATSKLQSIPVMDKCKYSSGLPWDIIALSWRQIGLDLVPRIYEIGEWMQAEWKVTKRDITSDIKVISISYFPLSMSR